MHTLGSQCVYISGILKPDIFTVKSQDAVHTLGSQCVYISGILKPDIFKVKSQDAVHTLGSQCVYISEIFKPLPFAAYVLPCVIKTVVLTYNISTDTSANE